MEAKIDRLFKPQIPFGIDAVDFRGLVDGVGCTVRVSEEWALFSRPPAIQWSAGTHPGLDTIMEALSNDENLKRIESEFAAIVERDGVPKSKIVEIRHSR